MALSVTNSLTDDRETFETDGDEVLLYVCGLTVSDDAHLGHGRVWVHADICRRWLEQLGYDVRHVENVTDVNEKIVARVGETAPEADGRGDRAAQGDGAAGGDESLGADERAVATRFTASILRDMRGLNLRRAEVYPRVTEHIDEVIDLVERLVDRGYAYESNGSVYFDVSEFDGYGELSGQAVGEMEPQGSDEGRAEKRDPRDFALWKAGGVDPEAVVEHQENHAGSAPPETAVRGAETWDSPWSEGRPGWHIECSAMSMAHLGETIDIHMGGQDIAFPHHENEIAQSEAATGEEFVRYWLHVGLLETDGEKMSSSLANFTTVSDALKDHGPNVLRTFYLGAGYRTRQTYSTAAVEEAEERWERLERAYERARDACDSADAHTSVSDEALQTAVDDAETSFREAMNDDFNVREAMAALLDLAAAANRHVDDRERYDYRGLRRTVETFERLGGDVFGLQFDEATAGTARLAGELVELVLSVRAEERAAGNYDRADELRAALTEVGVEVEDGPDGASYRFVDRGDGA